MSVRVDNFAFYNKMSRSFVLSQRSCTNPVLATHRTVRHITISKNITCSLTLKINKYVLSTMGVSKESISKFLIVNRFHVKLRILSPYLN